VKATAARGRPVAILTKTWPKLSETFVLGEILSLERRGYARGISIQLLPVKRRRVEALSSENQLPFWRYSLANFRFQSKYS